MSTALSVWQNHWELVSALVAKDLKVRYKGTMLGYLWSILHPLALTLIFNFVFKEIFKASIPDFHLFLLAALLPWTWLASSINGGAGSFVGNAHLIKKVRFPRLLIPLATVLNNMVHFLLSLPVYLAFTLAAGKLPAWNWLIGIPLLVLLELIFILGLTLAIASLNVYFRDVSHFVSVVLSLWFYVTPIMYSPSMLPPKVQLVLAFHPATHLIEAWRNLLVENRLDLETLCLPAAIAAAVMFFGLIVFKRLERGFADVL